MKTGGKSPYFSPVGGDTGAQTRRNEHFSKPKEGGIQHGGLRGAAEGGHQKLPIRLVWIADIVDGRFQR